MAILHLMNAYHFRPSLLQDILNGLCINIFSMFAEGGSILQSSHSEQGLQVNFSNVRYRDIAPFIGLDHLKVFCDAETFELHRSHIPTQLLKCIVQDLDMMLTQYGPLDAHQTEQTRSRFLSPVSVTHPLGINAGLQPVTRRYSIAWYLYSTLLLETNRSQ